MKKTKNKNFLLPKKNKNKEKMSKNRPRMLISNKKDSEQAEQFRMIRTNIEFINKKRHIKQILITSAQSKEGKSTVIANLADIMGRQNLKILIIDADLRKPTQHHILSVPNSVGLADVLRKKLAYKECIQETFFLNVDVVTAGMRPHNPSELLSSLVFIEALDYYSQHYDYILIDSPPAVVVDTQILASQIEGTVVVVEENSTKKHELQNILTLLQKTDTTMLGIILNKSKKKNNNPYYNY
ncbi:putative tyrosine-protein kinase CapB [Carnobacterium maltaromaticum]|uniref:CpsD/CapB family tyrosine-protein kinase n=1 Tax=Carnobacterium maltaromaticum TaxID=2751 RepID=UPI00191BB65F|nr:CpsD/CapB family tyrosine-protein kinase [Carnobacterium maltaromaticum]CAD5902612.1 putative tyrosine-protein kinase CapB [Carnobacterium maltaromaticum]